MATLRPFYAGDRVSAKQFNELVCAIECLCSQMKNLQRDQRASSFQNVATQHRYLGKTEGDDLSFNAKILSIQTTYITLENSTDKQDVLPFTPVEGYIAGGAIFDGKGLVQLGWVQCDKDMWVCNGGYFDTCALRGGASLTVDGSAVHRGSGIIERGVRAGYGAVVFDTDTNCSITISSYPYHIMNTGIDMYAGGSLQDNSVESRKSYTFDNSIRIADGEQSIAYPCGEGYYFVSATASGVNSDAGWRGKPKLSCVGGANLVARPEFCSQITKHWFYICNRGVYDRESGLVATHYYGNFYECDTNWRMSVPVAYSFWNKHEGLTCVRMLEQEILVAPSPMLLQPAGKYELNNASAGGEDDLEVVCTNGHEPTKLRVQDVGCRSDLLMFCLPTAIPKNCFIPAFAMCDWKPCSYT